MPGTEELPAKDYNRDMDQEIGPGSRRSQTTVWHVRTDEELQNSPHTHHGILLRRVQEAWLPGADAIIPSPILQSLINDVWDERL